MGTRKSVTKGQHKFAQIPSAEIQRSSFDRSCGIKTAFDSGLLIPVFVDEALPGDTMSLNMSTFARLATPIHPIMDNMYLDTHFFAVPYRLLWDNWEKFNGAQEDPGDSTDFLIPSSTAPIGGYVEESLHDYMGIPTKVGFAAHSSLPTRAYHLIWNEWFRDENLQDSAICDRDDGPDDGTLYVLQRRGKRHDYFTSALPFPQKGPSVQLPLGTTAPVIPDPADGNPTFIINSEGSRRLFMGTGVSTAGFTGSTQAQEDAVWEDPGLLADLSTATAATINQIRQAFQVQKLYERDARGGTRYTEIVRSHFGVISPDQRLQRPEYLGGGSTPVGITSVPQNSQTDSSAQGNLAGFGTAVSSGHGFQKSFVEHCVIIGLVSVRADLNYQQGLNRMWSRRTRWDFYWPALSHLGEQTILNKEIFYGGGIGNPDDDEVFGYQERFAEYRYKPSLITGRMRSNSAVPLDVWHLAQDFAALPVLGDTFIQETPPVARVIAVPSEPEFILDGFFSYKCARPMPVYGVPGLIDHF